MLAPCRFIGEPIEVHFDEPPDLEKRPGCPDRFTWRGATYRVVERIDEWSDFGRKGRFARNMRPGHAAVAAGRGSWGVGRFFFRVRVEQGWFELYYDRAPRNATDRKGSWFLRCELSES